MIFVSSSRVTHAPPSLTFASHSKTIQNVVRPTRYPRQQWPRCRTKNGDISIVFFQSGGAKDLSEPLYQNYGHCCCSHYCRKSHSLLLTPQKSDRRSAVYYIPCILVGNGGAFCILPKDKSVQEELTAWPWRWRALVSLEWWVTTYESPQRNIMEENHSPSHTLCFRNRIPSFIRTSYYFIVKGSLPEPQLSDWKISLCLAPVNIYSSRPSWLHRASKISKNLLYN